MATCPERVALFLGTGGPHASDQRGHFVGIRTVHLSNQSTGLALRVHELGSAALSNYVALLKTWFDYDLSQYNFYLMPLAFFRDLDEAEVIVGSREEGRVLDFVRKLAEAAPDEEDAAVLLRMDVRLRRSREVDATRVQITDDEDAIAITMTEEDIRREYPWDYSTLCTRLSRRYSDFSMNRTFHEIKRPLKEDPTYVHRRYLDPANPKSGRKDFYSQNVLNVFDQHYTRRENDA